jgi:hypothetical protein
MSAKDRRERVKPALESRVLRYLRNHPEGLSTSQIYAWIRSCNVGGGYTLQEFDTKLGAMRKARVVGYANGLWYLPKPIVAPPPVVSDSRDSGPLFEERGRGTR